MAFRYDWKIKTKIYDYTAPDGEVFKDTIYSVLWHLTCTDTDTGKIVTAQGQENLPPPKTRDNFIEFSDILSKTKAQKRDTVLSIAEISNPGLVNNWKGRVKKNLEKKLGTYQETANTSVVSII